MVIKDASNYPEKAKQDFASDNLQNQNYVFPATAQLKKKLFRSSSYRKRTEIYLTPRVYLQSDLVL